MPSHVEWQQDFARAVLDTTLPLPAGVQVPAGAVRAERFAVYRNNIAVGLIEALRASFPVVEQLVGREFFTAMARTHAQQSPPSSPVLLEYGADFPQFIEEFEPAATVPYLADVARLEWHWLESYHAADAPALAIAALEVVPMVHLPGLKLVLHPSARILGFAHPALSVWRLHAHGAKLERVEIPSRGEAVLIVRPQTEVATLALSPGALVFLQSIRSNQSVEAAATAALAREPDLGMTQLLRRLFEARTFAGFIDTRGARQ